MTDPWSRSWVKGQPSGWSITITVQHVVVLDTQIVVVTTTKTAIINALSSVMVGEVLCAFSSPGKADIIITLIFQLRKQKQSELSCSIMEGGFQPRLFTAALYCPIKIIKVEVTYKGEERMEIVPIS